jgi:hypothetical protein
MHTIEDFEDTKVAAKLATLRVHPLIYGQIYRLPPIESAVVQNVTFHEKFFGTHFAKAAVTWLEKLIELAYGKSDSAAMLEDEAPSLERLQGATDGYCEANGLSDDAFIVIAAVTLHRSEGADGEALLKGALATLNKMLARASAGFAKKTPRSSKRCK